jgi:inorganic triphosphatase YgiF
VHQPRETELKLLGAPGDLERLARADFLAAAETLGSVSIRTGYFDTPDRDFKKHGLFVRVRNSGDHWIQSVKQTSGVDRFESERVVSGPSPSLRLPEDLPALSAVTSAGALEQVFATQVQRKSFLLAANGATIEISFDRGDIVAPDGQVEPISEVELELKHGERAELFRIARRLSESAPVSFSLVSKGERGFLLTEKRSGRPHKAPKVHLSPGVSVAVSFATVCRACLHDFMLNLPASRSASDPISDQVLDIETVHQTRVAIRRLRAAMNFFRPCVEDREFGELKDGLRWISGLLGTARDFDVWQEDTIDRKAAAQKPGEGYSDLAAAMEERRLGAHRQLAEAIESQRLRLLLLDLAVWLEAGDWRTEIDRADKTPLLAFLEPRMRKAIRRLKRRGRNLETLGEHAQHKLRIRAKELRYSIEFFMDVLTTTTGRRRARIVLRALEDFQAAIGKMHDSASLAHFLCATFGAGHPNLDQRFARTAAFAAGRLTASPPRRKKLERKAARAFAKFARTRISWA